MRTPSGTVAGTDRLMFSRPFGPPTPLVTSASVENWLPMPSEMMPSAWLGRLSNDASSRLSRVASLTMRHGTVNRLLTTFVPSRIGGSLPVTVSDTGALRPARFSTWTWCVPIAGGFGRPGTAMRSCDDDSIVNVGSGALSRYTRDTSSNSAPTSRIGTVPKLGTVFGVIEKIVGGMLEP